MEIRCLSGCYRTVSQSAGSQWLLIHWSSLIQASYRWIPSPRCRRSLQIQGSQQEAVLRCRWDVVQRIGQGSLSSVRAEIIAFRCVYYIWDGSGSTHSCPPFLGFTRPWHSWQHPSELVVAVKHWICFLLRSLLKLKQVLVDLFQVSPPTL